jgi:hypothetical protein
MTAGEHGTKKVPRVNAITAAPMVSQPGRGEESCEGSAGVLGALTPLPLLPVLGEKVEHQPGRVDRLIDRPDHREHASWPGVTGSVSAIESHLSVGMAAAVGEQVH